MSCDQKSYCDQSKGSKCFVLPNERKIIMANHVTNSGHMITESGRILKVSVAQLIVKDEKLPQQDFEVS